MPERKCVHCGANYQSHPHDARSLYCSFRCALDNQILIKSDNECWPWQGRTVKGYGAVRIHGTRKYLSAHRLAYQIHVGEVPEGHVVRHSCDNPACCNYKRHLITGTKMDNTSDAVIRGRLREGMRHHAAKFTPELVVKYRQQYLQGRSCLSMANEFGCCRPAMERMVRGFTWNKIPGAVVDEERKYRQCLLSPLTGKQVEIIRAMPLVLFSQADLGRLLKVSPKTIWSIRHGKRWAHL